MLDPGLEVFLEVLGIDPNLPALLHRGHAGIFLRHRFGQALTQPEDPSVNRYSPVVPSPEIPGAFMVREP